MEGSWYDGWISGSNQQSQQAQKPTPVRRQCKVPLARDAPCNQEGLQRNDNHSTDDGSPVSQAHLVHLPPGYHSSATSRRVSTTSVYADPKVSPAMLVDTGPQVVVQGNAQTNAPYGYWPSPHQMLASQVIMQPPQQRERFEYARQFEGQTSCNMTEKDPRANTINTTESAINPNIAQSVQAQHNNRIAFNNGHHQTIRLKNDSSDYRDTRCQCVEDASRNDAGEWMYDAKIAGRASPCKNEHVKKGLIAPEYGLQVRWTGTVSGNIKDMIEDDLEQSNIDYETTAYDEKPEFGWALIKFTNCKAVEYFTRSRPQPVEVYKHCMYMSPLPPNSQNTVLFNNFPLSDADSNLRRYIENLSENKVSYPIYLTQRKPTQAMISFHGNIDIRKLSEGLSEEPFGQHLLTAHPVPVSDAILVQGIKPEDYTYHKIVSPFEKIIKAQFGTSRPKIRYTMIKEKGHSTSGHTVSKQSMWAIICLSDEQVFRYLPTKIDIGSSVATLRKYYDLIGPQFEVITDGKFFEQRKDKSSFRSEKPISFLSNQKNRHCVDAMMKKHGVQGQWDVDQGAPGFLKILAATPKIAQQMFNIIQQLIETESKEFCLEEIKYIADDPAYLSDFIKTNSTLIHYELDQSNVRSIKVSGLRDDVDEFMKQLQIELDEKVIYTKVIIKDEGHMQYLEKVQNINILQQVDATSCSIAGTSNNLHIVCPVSARGTKFKLDNLFSIIRTQLQDVETESYKINVQHRMLPKDQVEIKIDPVERITKTAITLSSAVAEKDEEDVCDMELHGTYTCASVKIFVVKGEIASFRGSAVINPANADLQLGGGVAGVIKRCGGPRVAAECKDVRQRFGIPIPPGQSVSTTAGDMKCDRIIHAVGQRSTYKDSVDDDILRTTIQSIFTIAQNESMTSICIPALSCGIFAHDRPKAIHSIVDETAKFLNRMTSGPPMALSQIYFIDNQYDCINIFKNECSIHEYMQPFNWSDSNGELLFDHSPSSFKEAAATYDWIDEDNPTSTTSASTSYFHPGFGPGSDSSSIEVAELPASPVPDLEPANSAYLPPSGAQNIGTTRIGFVVADDVSSHHVDVLVNSLGGQASKHILNKAGSTVADQVAKSSPNKRGIIKTVGGALVANHIYHVHIPAGAGNLQSLERTVDMCLSQAEEDGVKSIAFPALGTGTGGYQPDDIAKMFLKVFKDRFQPHRDSRIQSAAMLLYSGNAEVINAFNKLWVGQVSATSSSTDMGPSSASIKIETPFNVNLEKRVIGNKITQITMVFSQLTVTLYNGDITTDTADIIMIPCGEKPTLDTGAVADALLQKDPVQIKAGLDKCVYRDNVSIVDCRSRVVQYRRMIIVNANDLSEWDQLLLTALEAADQAGCHSLAMPLVATGGFSASRDDALAIIFKCLCELAVTGFSNLINIKIVLWKEDLDQTFQTLQALVSPPTGEVKNSNWSKPAELIAAGFDWLNGTSTGIPMTTTVPIHGTTHVTTLITPPELHLPTHYYITGLKKNIQEARHRLESMLNDLLPKSEIDRYTGIVNKLSKDEVKMIKHDWPTLTGVIHCNVNIDQDYGVITLTGVNCDRLKRKILDFLEKKNEAAATALTVQWRRFRSGCQPAFIGELLSFEVEKKYISCGKQGHHRLHYLDGSVDFDQSVIFHGTKSYYIERHIMGEGEKLVPHNWKHRDINEQGTYEIKVARQTPEFKKIQDLVHKSAPDINLKKVVRMEHVKKVIPYTTHLRSVKERLSTDGINLPAERLLFHGTAADSLDKIKAESFNRAFAGDANAKVYGHGTYFARDFTLSQDYSQEARKMLVVRVITGEWCEGNADFKAAPYKEGGNTGHRYDSVVNELADPTIFVVFNDNSAYPAYIIEW